MYCGECGVQNPDTNRFCSSCGQPLGRPAGEKPAAVPSVPVPPDRTTTAPAQALPVAPKRNKNWTGFISMVTGILSWIILTGVLALSAILAGIISLIWFRRTTGRIGVSAVIGIVLGIGALAAKLALP